MLNSIVAFSLRRRIVVMALAAALMGYGIFSLEHARFDVFPEFAPPRVQILTEAPGLAAEQVELLVTQPIENAIAAVPEIEQMRSNSMQGVSAVNVVFRPDTQIYLARQLVGERLSTVAGRLPAGVGSPTMTPLTSSTNVVLEVGVSSAARSLIDLRTVADWTVRPRLLSVPGVAAVTIWGGGIKQFQVQYSPERLAQYKLALGDVLEAARRATGLRGAGLVDTPNQRLILQSQGQALTASQIGSTVVVYRGGAAVTLGQITTVTESQAPPISAASISAQPAVVMVVSEQYGANTLEVTDSVEHALDELRPVLGQQGIQLRSDLFRPANFIQTALHNIRTSLLIGAILVALVLVLLLFNFRTAAISCAAIPVSLLAAVTALERLGYTLNIMTLGGLAIAIGEVVDDAVIDVENILRRLRENRGTEHPRPAIRVVFDASIEVRGAVVYATFAVTLVFFPILAMSGLAGRIFAPLGIAYIFAILASLGVALTLTPALSLMWLQGGRFREEEPPPVRWLKRGYIVLLRQVQRHGRIAASAVLLITAFALSLLPSLRESFIPKLQEGHFIVHMAAVPGTSLDQSLRIGSLVYREISRIPLVHAVSQRAGRAEGSEDILSIENSEIGVELKQIAGKQNELIEPRIREALGGIVGADFSVNTFLTERIEETVSGYTAPVVINLFGPDLEALDRESREVARELSAVPGVTGMHLQSPPGTPQLTLRLRPAELLHWGFDPVTVLDAIQTAFSGEPVGQVFQGNRVFDVVVVVRPEDRRTRDIGSLTLRNPAGDYVPLSQLADISEESGRSVIQHQGGRRVETITCDVSGRTVSSFVSEARDRIASHVKFPAGTYAEFTGTAAEAARARQQLLLNSILAGLGIVLLLSIVTMNYRNLLLVLLNLPMAIIGGIFAVVLAGGVLSLGAQIAFVTLFGITLRNSIMLISHYEHLVDREGMEWSLEAAVRGASERLLPILMTATVTALGLLPLAVGSGAPGREIEGPMAIVILGGLLTSTTLNLLVLPVLALRYGRFQRRRPEL